MRHSNFFSILLGSASIVTLIGCTDNLTTPQPAEPSAGYTYHLECTAATANKADKTGTRALTEDEFSKINSAWDLQDKLIFYSLSDNDKSTRADYDKLAAQNKGKSAAFNGDIHTVNPLKLTDKLCFLYPGDATNNAQIARPVQYGTVTYKDENNINQTVKGYLPQKTIKNTLEVNLTRQDGTIKTISKRYDYQWAAVTPKKVTGNDIKAYAGTLTRLVAFWGMRFCDKNKKILTDIDSIFISNINSLDILDLKQGKFVGSDAEDKTFGLKLVADVPNNGKLTSANGKYTYAAVLPGTYYEVTVIVYIGDKMYEQTLSKCTFAANGIYRDDIVELHLVDENAGFVDVQGVKWATGNLIHYATPGEEYWGIAPTQWWIADYFCDNSSSNRPRGSQFTNNYSKRVDNQDVFSFGNIDKALDDGDYWLSATAKDIDKQFFTVGTAFFPTTDKSKAKFGDLAYYHTMENRHVYRLPKDAEMKTLINQANAYSAYCYTDMGNKVYGAFFYTCKPEAKRIVGFPTGARNLYKYNDVTPLVRAQKGLFLPITGKRNVGSSIVGFRDMSYVGAYAQYMTAYSVSSGLNRCFFFGPTEALSFRAGVCSQGIAIRPVLDKEDTTKPQDPKHSAFAGLK